jgi:hypothetical protein
MALALPVPLPREKPMDQDAQITEITHARKQRNTKGTRKDGVRCIHRSGYAAYIEYNAPFGVEYFPGSEGGMERIQYRSGDSAVTIEGRNLFPHFEDLQAKHCDTLRESDHAQETAALGVPYIETITVRLWL